MEFAVVIFGACWTALAGYLAYRHLKKEFKDAGVEDIDS